MEPNKIEKQIREKLNSREIQQSSQAWDRLDAMLSIAEEKKTKRSFGWLSRSFGIAASILVFVSVGMFFYNQGSIKGTTNEIVVGVEKDTVKQNSAVAETPNENLNSNKEKATLNPINKQSVAIVAVQPTNNSTEKRFSQSNQKTNSNPIINKEKAIEFQNSSDVALKNLPKIIEPNKEISIPKPTITNQNALATNEENKVENSSKVKVNANSLLSEVDGELDLTFREKVFKKVTKNYKEVKVALSNRNNL